MARYVNHDQTWGFVNHVPTSMAVADVNHGGWMFECGEDPEAGTITFDIEGERGSVGQRPQVRLTLNKREAIYLRNRLTAFIERGLDQYPED